MLLTQQLVEACLVIQRWWLGFKAAFLPSMPSNRWHPWLQEVTLCGAPTTFGTLGVWVHDEAIQNGTTEVCDFGQPIPHGPAFILHEDVCVCVGGGGFQRGKMAEWGIPVDS